MPNRKRTAALAACAIAAVAAVAIVAAVCGGAIALGAGSSVDVPKPGAPAARETPTDAAGAPGAEGPDAAKERSGDAAAEPRELDSVGLFRDLAVYVGRGDGAWAECADGDPWDFSVEGAAGRGARFAFSEGWLAEAAAAGVAPDVWGFVGATNGRPEFGGAPPFEEASGAGVLTLSDPSGRSAAYADCEALRELAEAARLYAEAVRSGDGPGVSGPPRNEYGYTKDQMEGIYITPEGEAVANYEFYVYFLPDITKEGISLLLEREGFSPRKIAGSIDYHFEAPDGTDGIIMGSDESVWPRGSVVGVAVVVPDDMGIEAAKSAMEALPEVSRVDYVLPGIAELSEMGGTLPAEGGVAPRSYESYLQYYLRYAGFEEAWKTARCEGAVSLAVIDSGIDLEQPEVAPNIDAGRMANVADGTVESGPQADMDDYGASDPLIGAPGPHGTHVAGVISALAGDDAGCDGASYNAAVIPVKVTDAEGKTNVADISAAYEYILGLDDPPDVINLSIVVPYPGATIQDVKNDAVVSELQARISLAWSRGIVTVASAGNDGKPEELMPPNPDGTIHVAEAGVDYNRLNVPACLDDVISVGALEEPGWLVSPEEDTLTLCDWSNTVSAVDVCSYGESILVPKADRGLVDWYVTVNGTSFAAPQVAAAAALVKRAHPGYSADDVERAIEGTARRADAMGGGERTDEYGYGALDAAAAVLWSDQRNPDPSRPGAGGGWSPTAGGNLAEMYRAEREGE